VQKRAAMFYFKVTRLVTWVVICVGTMSCQPLGSHAAGEAEKSDDSAKAIEKRGQRVLSKEDILQAVDRYFGLGRYRLIYDEGNAGWKESAMRRIYGLTRSNINDDELERAIREKWPMLKGHDYQVVQYLSPSPRPGQYGGRDGGGTVLVDRETGKMLAVLNIWGWVQ
jgi:hypothetical protein